MNFFSEVEKTIEREFRKWTEKAFGPGESDELILVHRSILEEIESKIQTLHRGAHVFPYNRLTVRIGLAEPARRAVFVAALSENRRLENDIHECLGAAGCELAGGLSVEVEAAENTPKTFEILYERLDAPPVTAVKPEAARLVVVRGKANLESFVLDKRRTNIGRLPELLDSRERLVRRNDIIFEDGADEANATVSRGHAHIRFDAASSEYRICDDSSEYGTRIFREGRSIAVPSGSQRGERLTNGDEIYLGRACMRFEI